ncbi:phosphoesterase [Caenispirillum salinarum AK4]|uniref:Phosphoesterase n=1 Tax=Caenispirillum salinarum AK4 TaxID=1238182 RepID=K9HFY7_9PROT|nr:vanadium-dependent haloperoxidase [Caenispirillum salinarum]EKV27546.1 phosphoesterase [Caenispirillum salinarum AK4]
MPEDVKQMPQQGQGPAASTRHDDARDLRERGAAMAHGRAPHDHDYEADPAPDDLATWRFTKGLTGRDSEGVLDPDRYRTFAAMLRDLRTGMVFGQATGRIAWGGPQASPYQHVETVLGGLAGGRKMVNPLAGMAFDLQGADAHDFSIPQPPGHTAGSVAERDWEMAELYWMAHLRDVPFTAWDNSVEIMRAAQALEHPSKPPTVCTTLTSRSLFRGLTGGDHAGPYISQFLLRDIPYGTLDIQQRNRAAPRGKDYMTDWQSWLDVQNGTDVYPGYKALNERRYLSCLRDLATYVHFDQLYEAYLNAALIMVSNPNEFPLKPGLGYGAADKQQGFGTLGGPHILSLVTEIATRALKAVWFQKWYVHRRMRPEEFGGRIYAQIHKGRNFGISITGPLEAALEPFDGRELLPMAFPEGSPTHPAYGAGHATVAGACVTILKAFFAEDQPIQNAVQANALGDALEPYLGGDLLAMTVGGELNKLAANISIGRNAAGVHWRSDYTESIILGERIALTVLQEQSLCLAETGAAFSLTLYDGTPITIENGDILAGGQPYEIQRVRTTFGAPCTA